LAKLIVLFKNAIFEEYLFNHTIEIDAKFSKNQARSETHLWRTIPKNLINNLLETLACPKPKDCYKSCNKALGFNLSRTKKTQCVLIKFSIANYW